MISYETAVKLKEAGFPQKYHDMGKYFLFGEAVVPFSAVKNAVNEEGHVVEYAKVLVYIPTLSELIAVIGMYFESLERISDTKWMATGYQNFDGNAPLKEINRSPEEAVAALYVVLHPVPLATQ